jgi:pantothenate kinase
MVHVQAQLGSLTIRGNPMRRRDQIGRQPVASAARGRRAGRLPHNGPMHLDELVDRSRTLVAAARQDTGRRILGIVGAPGAGKSTLAAAIVARLGDCACYVPMDGFHLAGAVLDQLGRRDRKGAVDTFDGDGYVALLRRLRPQVEEIVYAPQFRREIEEPVAGAIPVARDVPLVVTEGNYLLHREGPWVAVRDLLDEAWYLDPPVAVRHARLIERHEAYGKPPATARAWALGSDERNAVLVAAGRVRADLVIADAPTLSEDRRAGSRTGVGRGLRA